MQLCYFRFKPEAIAPTKKNPSDAGWDLYSCQRVVLTANTRFKFDIGLALWWELNAVQTSMVQQGGLGWYGRLADRSGLAMNNGLHVLGGVVDSGYRKEVGVVLLNTSGDPIEIVPGNPICQIVPTLVFEVREAYEREVIDSTVDRGAGFGSRIGPHSGLPPIR